MTCSHNKPPHFTSSGELVEGQKGWLARVQDNAALYARKSGEEHRRLTALHLGGRQSRRRPSIL